MNDICWSCQKPLPEDDLNRVFLTPEFQLPVCKKCWSQIPPSCRLKLALAFRDRGQNFTNIAEALEWLSHILEQAEFLPRLYGGDHHTN